MRRVRLTPMSLLVVASLIIGACGGGEASSDQANRDAANRDDSKPVDATGYSISPYDRSDDLISVDGSELDGEPLLFPGLVDLVERGVELGEWTEAEGVIALLRAQVGEISTDDIDGLDLVASASGTSLLDFAQDLVVDDTVDEDDRHELGRLLDMIVPSDEWIDTVGALIRPEPEPDMPGIRGPSSVALPAQTDDCVDAAPTHYPLVDRAPTVDCWKMIFKYVARPDGSGEASIVIVYPQGSEAFAEVTMEAMEKTTLTAFEWSDANPAAWVLINPEGMFDAEENPVWGAATVNDDSNCLVSLSQKPLALDDSFRQLVAHEHVHCFQHIDYVDFSKSDNWVIEGGADYFSHLIYPAGGPERQTVTTFLEQLLSMGLPQMSYQSWPWWQYLSNRSSPAAVFELHRRMVAGSGVDVLAAEPGMAETFQTFTVDLRTVGIPTHGAAIPESREILRIKTIDSTGERSHSVERFVAARLGVSYAPEHLYEQTDHTQSDGYMQMARFEERHDRSAWLGLPPEVRSSCTDPVTYVVAATTVKPDPHEVEWTIDEADEFTCDPCLGGTWILDNDRFKETIMSFGGMPAGFGFDIVGPYFVRFDGSSAGNAWRNDWQMITSGAGVSMTTTWDSIETFEYSADGERFEVWNSVMVDYRTALDAGGLPIGALATPDATTVSAFGTETTVGTQGDGPQSAGGSYTCSEQRLEISLDMAPGTPLVMDRTEDIPEPPLVLLAE